MLLRTKLLSFAVVMSCAGIFGCSGDEKPAEEPVTPAATQEPATPPDDANKGSASDYKSEPVYFAFDDYTVNSAAAGKLDKLAGYLKGSASAVVQVQGFCDERGSEQYNLALGERRAQSVKNYLTQLGVDAGRLSTISYGEENPAVQGHTEAAWAKNRRAEFVVSVK